jgi:hypothetical protein
VDVKKKRGIKQNPTTYKETTSFTFLLESSTTNQSIPSNIIYSPHPTLFFQKKRRKQNGHAFRIERPIKR